MIMNSKEKSLKEKEHGETATNERKLPRSSASSSRSWSGSRNPRIVRVSRTFGGKDRHSKVCTIRGLRDRRIRLSVPTAIQLYDLQDRLGVNQPSKVIDWLITVTKLDIDELPPLQLPPGFGLLGREILASPDNLDSNAKVRSKSNQMPRGENLGKEKWIKTQEDDEEDNEEQVHQTIRDYNDQISLQKLFQSANASTLPSLAYDNRYYLDQPSCLSRSQFGNHGVFQPQLEMTQTAHNSLQIPTLSSASSSQIFLCQPSVTPAPLFTPFPSYISPPLESSDTARLYRNIQMLNSTHLFSSPVKFFPPNVCPKPANSENGNSPEKDDPRLARAFALGRDEQCWSTYSKRTIRG